MKKTILVTILAFLLLPNLVLATLDIDITIKSSFVINETISFDYTITSNTNQNVTFIPHITCPNAPVAPLQEKTVQLLANQPYSDTYTDITVEQWIEPQTCTVYIQIRSPVQQKEEKNFTIDTAPSFDFDIKTCKDSACQQKAKVFYLNEKIYLDYDSSVSKPEITATLIYPDKTTKQVNLPSSIKAEQIGTYEIDVKASKEDYKTIERKYQFGVIEKKANISYVGEEIIDKDIEKDEEDKSNLLYYLVIVIFIFAILILALIIYLKVKNRSKQETVEVKQ